MAVSTPPTVRPYREPDGLVDSAESTGSVGGARVTADRVMLAPPARRPMSARRTRAHRWWLPRLTRGWALAALAASLVVVFGGTLAVNASTANQAAQQPPAPSVPSFPLPPHTPCPTFDTLCQALESTTTTAPAGTSGSTTPTASGQPTTTPTSPTTPASPTTTGTTPCTGEDCIPQPTPPPSGGDSQQPDGGEEGGSECGISDIGACISEAINAMFRSVVEAALSPILDLIGHTALSTPTISDLPGIGELWNNSWALVVAAYGLLILVGGIVVMGHESVQTRYSIKEIGPRIPIAFLASALSLFFADKLIRLANALTLGILGDGVNAPSLGNTLNEAVLGIASGGLFIILVGLVLVVVGLGLLIVYVVRIVITLILIISGPLFLMCHALPHTDPLARWWWKATAATLGIQVAQALVLVTAVRTFLSGGVHLFGSTMSALGTLVAAIALFFILFKIPFWLLRAVKVSSGRSFLGGLARAYVAAKTFGMVAGKSGGSAAAGAARGAANRSGGGGGNAGEADVTWFAPPTILPTADRVSQWLQAAHDAERARAARRSRLPSQAPQFLQPLPQDATHDPAVTPANPGATTPEFSAPSTPATPTPRRGSRPSSPPQFQTAGGPRRRGPVPPPARSIRTASVPPQLRFQPATPPAPQPSPARPVSGSAAPVFRQAQPEPRIGDAYRRTPSVPPPVFRAPKPTAGGDAT